MNIFTLRLIMQILMISTGDVLELKKPHPCGGRLFKVMRTGSEVRIVCNACGRDMTLDRIKLEKAIKKVIPSSEPPKDHSGGGVNINEQV